MIEWRNIRQIGFPIFRPLTIVSARFLFEAPVGTGFAEMCSRMRDGGGSLRAFVPGRGFAAYPLRGDGTLMTRIWKNFAVGAAMSAAVAISGALETINACNYLLYCEGNYIKEDGKVVCE